MPRGLEIICKDKPTRTSNLVYNKSCNDEPLVQPEPRQLAVPFTAAGTGGLHLSNRHQTLLEALQKWRAFPLCGCDGNWHTCKAQTFARAGSSPAIRTRGRIAKTGRRRIADPKMREFDSHSGLQRFFDNKVRAQVAQLGRGATSRTLLMRVRIPPCAPCPDRPIGRSRFTQDEDSERWISLGARPDGQIGKGAALRRRRFCEFESHSGHQVWPHYPNGRGNRLKPC